MFKVHRKERDKDIHSDDVELSLSQKAESQRLYTQGQPMVLEEVKRKEKKEKLKKTQSIRKPGGLLY